MGLPLCYFTLFYWFSSVPTTRWTVLDFWPLAVDYLPLIISHLWFGPVTVLHAPPHLPTHTSCLQSLGSSSPLIHSGLHPHQYQRALPANKFYMITSTSAVKALGKIILGMKGSHSLGCFPQWSASCGGLSTGILSLQTLLFSFHSLFKVSPGWNRFALRHWADSFNCFISNDPAPLIFACSSEDAEIAFRNSFLQHCLFFMSTIHFYFAGCVSRMDGISSVDVWITSHKKVIFLVVLAASQPVMHWLLRPKTLPLWLASCKRWLTDGWHCFPQCNLLRLNIPGNTLHSWYIILKNGGLREEVMFTIVNLKK